jgi:hypothetical protein
MRVFENWVLRRIFGPKTDDIIKQIKSRRIRWVGHVASMGEETEVWKVLVGKPKDRDHL